MATLASRLGGLARTGARLVVRRPPATARSMSGNTGVKHHPDLERWNNIRDNVDQLYDITDPKTFATTVVWGIVFPVLIFKAITNEGYIRNGDDSTGVKFGPKSDTYNKPQICCEDKA